ncbi:MAG: serine hydrolase [Saprospiraceae bacterium]|jgi:CubicO group peptidase (beta-lactamase class C family)|nr:serine hydrolase [Saprospiraceae bacterium]
MIKQVFLFSIVFFLSSQILNSQTIHQLSSNDYVKEFFVFGPFHQKGLKADDWANLLEIEFIENEELCGQDLDKIKKKPCEANANNFLDFNKVLGDSAVAVAYATFNISAEKSTKALLLTYVQDGAKIFVNGHHVSTYFGAAWGQMESFKINLNEGNNPVVIKVPNRDWGWMLSVKVLDAEKGKGYLKEKAEENEYFEFLNSDLQTKTDANFSSIFRPGRFPGLVFEKPGLAKKYLGEYEMSVRWFDRDLNEIQYPKAAGRYAYYAEIKGSNGVVIKKSKTLFCPPQDWMGWTERLSADLEYFPINGVSKAIWTKHQTAIGEYLGFGMLKSMLLQEDAAVFLAFLDEANRRQLPPSSLNTPLILDGDYHAQLKQKILNSEGKYPELQLPKKVDQPLSVLQPISQNVAEKYVQLTTELRRIGKEWMDNEGAPFDMVLAQNSQMIFHESFGENDYGKFTIETPSEIASITKLFTGMLFAQFVEQGIIGIDDPVGKYLPDFPLEGSNALTLRHCFTHTSGFNGHGIFGGVHNPWLENSLAQVIKEDTVGTKHNYNGMGYDLAGKVMETVTGKSIFRLFQEYLYEPLEMKNTVHDWDLGYSVHGTAYDLAKMAQMLLNKGTYGNHQFFSEAVYDQLIPKELKEFYPNIRQKWGIGITMMSWWDSEENRFLLNDNVIGHGSATASVFWVIPELDMIITQSRRRGHRNYGPNFKKMIGVLEKHFGK